MHWLTESCQPLSSGTQYIFDQNGNPAVDSNGRPISPAPDAGASYSWKGAYLARGAEVVNSSLFPALGQSDEATSAGNQTHNHVAMLQHGFGLFRCETGYGAQGRPPRASTMFRFGLTTVTDATGAHVTRPSDSNIGQFPDFASTQPGWVGIVENSALTAYRKAFAEYPIRVALASAHSNGSSTSRYPRGERRIDARSFVIGLYAKSLGLEAGFGFPSASDRFLWLAD